MRVDAQPDIENAAFEVLLAAVHPLLSDPLVGESLAAVLVTFKADRLVKLRRQIEQLLNLFERQDVEGRKSQIEKLESLSSSLPAPSSEEQLAVILGLQSWDLADGGLRSRADEILRSMSGRTEPAFIRDALGERQVPAAWELGHALAALDGKNARLEKALLSVFTLNPAALVGYLNGLVDAGDGDAFDDFLDSTRAPQSMLGDSCESALRCRVARSPLPLISPSRANTS
jgi:hypothetical protein